MKKQELRRGKSVTALRLNKETIRLLEEGPALEQVAGAESNSFCEFTRRCCQLN